MILAHTLRPTVKDKKGIYVFRGQTCVAALLPAGHEWGLDGPHVGGPGDPDVEDVRYGLDRVVRNEDEGLKAVCQGTGLVTKSILLSWLLQSNIFCVFCKHTRIALIALTLSWDLP